MWHTVAMKKQHVELSKSDRVELEGLLRKGKLPARVYQRVVGLLELDRGKTITAVAETLGVQQNSVRAWRDKYKAQGLHCLQDAPRAGRPPTIDGAQRAKITALACSTPPAGHARWTLRLLADKIVELAYCEQISHTQVRQILKKTSCSRT
jgi:putative transposase